MAKRMREKIEVGKDANGKPIVEWVDGYNRQEILIKAAKVIQKYGLGGVAQVEQVAQPASPYFKVYLEQWWKLYKLPKLRHTTLTSYRNAIDHRILPFFKDMRLEDITTSTIQAFYNECSNLAKSSVHQMTIILHQVFDLAVEDGFMSKNPTESKRLYISSPKGKKRDALTDSQIKSIMENLYLLEAKDRIPLALLIYTGMRRGESLGLRWENIDWKNGIIHIENNVTFHNNQPMIGDTKSEAGRRIIPLETELARILKPHRQLNGFIVGDGIKPMTERAYTRMWQRIGTTISLYGATPHVFRHTFITLAASSGIDVKTLQSIAGHSDIKMTFDVYAHARKNKIIEAGQLIEGVFRGL